MSSPAHRSTPQRVVITGMGALSPGGVGITAYGGWLAEPAAQRPMRLPEFNPASYIPNPKLLRSMHRSFQLVAAAAVLALRQAGLPTAESLAAGAVAPERAGIAAALADLSPLTHNLLRVLAQATPTEGGAIDWGQFAELSLHQLHPFRRLTLLANMAAAHTSLLFGLQGPSFTLTSGAAAGSQAIAQAFWTVLHNRADLMLCQTADAPEQWFSAHPPAEIGGALVMESWGGAQRRGAAVIAEVVPDAEQPEAGPFTLNTSEVGSPVPRFMAALLKVNRAAQRGGGETPRIQLAALLGGGTRATAPGMLA